MTWHKKKLKKENKTAILTSSQRYKFFLQITNASSFLLSGFIAFANSIRAPCKHAAPAGLEKGKCFLFVSSGKDTCCHVGIIDHSWLRCWYFTSLDQYIIGSKQEVKLNNRFVNAWKRELRLWGFTAWVHILAPSCTCQVTWGKWLHLTVSQFPLP